MSDDRAKSVILRRWRDVKERVTNCRETRLNRAADELNVARAELADLFAELYPGEDIAQAWEAESIRQPTQVEYDAMVEAEGATYAAMEGGSRMIAAWRAEHPDDDRDDLELISATDGPFANEEPAS